MKPIVPKTETPHRNILTLDLEKYLGQLKDWDISEDQKAEFIQALWNILLPFAKIGFEIHPVQQVQDTSDTHNNLTESNGFTGAFNQNMLVSSLIIRTQLDDKNDGGTPCA